jgi:hypothetical protein
MKKDINDLGWKILAVLTLFLEMLIMVYLILRGYGLL